MINFSWHKFYDLTLDQLYSALALRSAVFVMGQRCIYQDADDKDQKALHLLGFDENCLVAYARLFPPDNDKSPLIFGRVAVINTARGKGYGKLLMKEVLRYCHEKYPGTIIKCSAQHYLLKFYQELGFIARGDIYMEEDIPHIEMLHHASS